MTTVSVLILFTGVCIPLLYFLRRQDYLREEIGLYINTRLWLALLCWLFSLYGLLVSLFILVSIPSWLSLAFMTIAWVVNRPIHRAWCVIYSLSASLSLVFLFSGLLDNWLAVFALLMTVLPTLLLAYFLIRFHWFKLVESSNE